MIHSSFSSEGHFLPKRTVFDFTGPSRNNDRPGSAEHIKSAAEDLSALGLVRVTEDVTRNSLEDLRGGVELQQSAQQREEQEVNALVLKSSIEKGLDNPEQREQFMSDVQLRLAVTLALLVNDQEIPLSHLQSGSIDATIQELLSKKDTIKIGERNLYNHEKALLGLPATLSGHTNNDVKEAWETMKGRLMANVQILRSTARIITETEAEESESFSLPEEAQKVLEAVKKQWDGLSPETKTIAKVAGAAGSLWLLYRMCRGITQGGSSSLWSTLGIGALLAGGLYIAGKYMSFNEALDKLKEGFANMDPTRLSQGLTAYFAGNLEAAKRYWGEHYDAMVERLTGRRGTGTPSSPRESGERGAENDEVPVDAALENYYEDIRTMADPFISRLESNSHWIWAIGLAFPSQTARFSLAALNTGKNISLPLLKILTFGARQAFKHPFLTSTLVVSYFIHKAATEREYTLPASIGGLKNKIKEERREIAEYARTECDGWEIGLTDAQIDNAADVVSGEKSITEVYGITPEQVEEMAVNAISEGFRVDDIEKLEDRNKVGLSEFRSTLHSFIEGEKYTSFIPYLINLRKNVSITFTDAQLEALKTEASKFGITVWTEETSDGYIWWRRSDHPEEIYSCGIDPNQTAEDQVEAATRFDPNPNSLASNLNRSLLVVPFEEFSGGISEVIDMISRGDGAIVIGEAGVVTLWDGVKERYINLPINFTTRIFKAMSGERFQTKEYLFDCAGAMVPVAVLGTATMLAKKFIFKTAISASKLRILAETATFPVAGPLKLGVSFGKRIVAPFGRGLLQGRGNPLSGFAEIYRRNMRDLTSTIRRVRYDVSRLTRLPENMRQGFRKIIACEDAMSELAKLRVSQGGVITSQTEVTSIIQRARELLTSGGHSAEEALRLVPENVASGLMARDLTGVMDALRNEITAVETGLSGRGAISPDDIARVMSAMDEADEVLRLERVAAQGAGAVGAVAPEARAAVEGAEALRPNRVAQLADTLADLRHGREVSEEALNTLRRSENLDELTDMLRRIGAGDGAGELIEALRTGESSAELRTLLTSLDQPAGTLGTRLDILEAVDVLKASQHLRPDQIEMLRNPAHADDIRAVLTRSGVQADEAARLVSRLQADEGVRSLETALQRSEMSVAEAAAIRPNAELQESLELLARRGDIKLDDLTRIVEGVRNAGTADDVAAALRRAGASDEVITNLMRGLSQERDVGRLARILEGTGIIKLGRSIKSILGLYKYLGHLGTLGGAAFSAYEAATSYYMWQETQNNPELRAIYQSRYNLAVGVGGAELVLDLAAWAGRIGGTAVIPLVVILETGRYVYGAALDAQEEIAKTSENYIQEALNYGITQSGIELSEGQSLNSLSSSQKERVHHESINNLLQLWYTTGEDFNAGEIYSGRLNLGPELEEFGSQRVLTRIKIITALLQLDSPGHEPGSEYLQYRFRFIETHANYLMVQTFSDALDILNKSKLFADQMSQRMNLPEGKGLPGLDVSHADFEASKISGSNIRLVMRAIESQTSERLREVVGGNERMYQRIVNMDINYLMYAAGVIDAFERTLTVNDEISTADQKLIDLGVWLQVYVRSLGRNFHRISSTTEGDVLNVRTLFFTENIEQNRIGGLMGRYHPENRHVDALYQVAKIFGHEGDAHLDTLKAFFDVNHADIYGFYWNGEQWYTNDVGGVDEAKGANLEQAIPLIIRRFRYDDDDIIKGRYDYMVQFVERDDQRHRREQLGRIIEILERVSGLAEETARQQRTDARSAEMLGDMLIEKAIPPENRVGVLQLEMTPGIQGDLIRETRRTVATTLYGVVQIGRRADEWAQEWIPFYGGSNK